MSDVVETRAQNDIFEVSFKTSHNVQAQKQEVKDCMEFLNIENAKFRRYKIILEEIEEFLEDDDKLDADLKAKVQNIIFGERGAQLRLHNNPVEGRPETVLGVPLNSIELTYSESSKLHRRVKAKLDDKYSRLKVECHTLFDEHSATKCESSLELPHEDLTLFDYRNKLVKEQEIYVNNQQELLLLLEDLTDIRLKKVPAIADQKYKECNVRSTINYLKSQLAKYKYRVDIFMESTHSFDAYTELIKDMKQQQKELRLEIEQLKDLKQKYADVACKEYDDILKSYLQYKSSLKKKKLMYELCK